MIRIEGPGCVGFFSLGGSGCLGFGVKDVLPRELLGPCARVKNSWISQPLGNESILMVGA